VLTVNAVNRPTWFPLCVNQVTLAEFCSWRLILGTIGVLGFDSRRVLGIFLFTTASGTASGTTQPPIEWVPRVLPLGVKRPGREADHPPHLVPRSKNAWSYTSTPQYAFVAWCLVKHRDNFTFYVYSPICQVAAKMNRCVERK
jgi:hypothetical protein